MYSVSDPLYDSIQEWIYGSNLVMNITTVVPIFNLTLLRRRNLEFVYSRLLEANGEIVFGIQDKTPDIKYYSSFKDAKLVMCPSTIPDIFNKGIIFNKCSRHVRTKFFMFLDADIYLPFKDIVLQEDDEVVKPFSQCVYLDEEKTAEFLEKRNVFVGEKYSRISCLGGGAVILKTDLAVRESLFDERFFGWGWEDIDLGDTLRARFKIRTIKQPAVHLYHEPCVQRNDNSKYYSEKTKPKSKIVHFFHFQTSNEVFSSYVKNREACVLLMNFSELDGLEDDSVKMCSMETNIFCLDLMASKAAPYVEDNGFILYLSSETPTEPGLYQRVLEEAREGHTVIMDAAGHVVGFGLNKSKFNGFGRPISPEGNYLEDISLILRGQGLVSEIKLQNHPCRCLEESPNTSCPTSASKCQES
jgi:hypothetical protein